MSNVKRKSLSLLLIMSLLIGMVGIVSVDTTYAASKKMHVKKKTVTLQVGTTYKQKLIAKNGKAIKAKKVKWKSKKKTIATISKSGKIIAIRPGKAKMTAKYKGKTYKFTVKVTAAPAPAPAPVPAPVPAPSQRTGLQVLHQLIAERGYTNGNGDKTVAFNIDEDLSTFFINHANSVEFSCYEKSETTNYDTIQVVNMELKLPSTDTANPKIQFAMTTTSSGGVAFEATGTIYVASYTNDTNVYFYITQSNAPSSVDLQKMCNASLKLAMSSWNLGLKYNFGMSLPDLGFASYN